MSIYLSIRLLFVTSLERKLICYLHELWIMASELQLWLKAWDVTDHPSTYCSDVGTPIYPFTHLHKHTHPVDIIPTKDKEDADQKSGLQGK